MEGAIELAEEIFHVPVRLGLPGQVKGLADVVRNPIYSTGVGLLLYARENTARRARRARRQCRRRVRAHAQLVRGISDAGQ